MGELIAIATVLQTNLAATQPKNKWLMDVLLLSTELVERISSPIVLDQVILGCNGIVPN
jgi:hypothetical protein